MRYKKLVTRVESHANAVSLLESGKECCIKVSNNNNNNISTLASTSVIVTLPSQRTAAVAFHENSCLSKNISGINWNSYSALQCHLMSSI